MAFIVSVLFGFVCFSLSMVLFYYFFAWYENKIGLKKRTSQIVILDDDSASFKYQIWQKINNMFKRLFYLNIIDLEKAGLEGEKIIYIYLFMKFNFIFFGSYFLFASFSKLSIVLRVIIALFAAIVLNIIVKEYINILKRRKTARVEEAFPDFLDLFSICLRSGYTLDRAVKRVSIEFQNIFKDLSFEMLLFANSIAVTDFHSATEKLQKRVDIPIIHKFIASIIQSSEYGTPLAASILSLAKDIRTEKFLKTEEKANKIPTLMTLPLMVFILPTLFIIILAPILIKSFGSF